MVLYISPEQTKYIIHFTFPKMQLASSRFAFPELANGARPCAPAQQVAHDTTDGLFPEFG
jgi:hypothetical protein